MPMTLLTPSEIDARLAELDGWKLDDKMIQTTYIFRDFVQAFGFMSQAAICAERMNHHPDWSNVYKTVKVSLSTHEAGGLTQLDFDLAREFSSIAESMT